MQTWTAAWKRIGVAAAFRERRPGSQGHPHAGGDPEGRGAAHSHVADGFRHLLPRGAAHVHLFERQPPLVDEHHRAVPPQDRPDVVDRGYAGGLRRATGRRPHAAGAAFGRRRAVAARHDQVPMFQLPRYCTCSGVNSSIAVPSEATFSRAISWSTATGTS